jgi:tetratricopeptide (TPR) repeat protein
MTSKDKNTILNEALKYHHEGKLAEADNLYLKVLSLDKNDFNANHLHGCILSQRNDYEDAIKFITRAVEVIPSNYEANNNLGIAYKNLQDKANAEKYFHRAIDIDQTNYKSYFNCANLYSDVNQFDKSIEFLKSAVKHAPDNTDVKHRLGEVYQYKYQEQRDKNNLRLAEECFLDVIKLNDTYVNAYIMLGVTYLWLEKIQESNNMFKSAHTLIHKNKDQINFNINKYLDNKKSLETFIKHEYEQLTFIDSDMDEIRNPKFTQEYYNHLKELYQKVESGSFETSDIPLSFKKEMFKVLYNKPPKIRSDHYINQSINHDQIQKNYLENNPELVVIDDFLQKEQLSELQKYCRNANIFKYPYQMGYVAAFLSKGMSSEFFLNLSEDLRKTFNLIFKNYQLTQAWIFKYENSREGTKIHADQASINVNFWITPDEANLSKESGGLVIWNKLPPSNWSFNDYNSVQSLEKIEKMLDSEGIEKKVIPYKENRCVIFNSKLFHCTDKFDFDKSYPHRRINITLLYD